MSLKNNNRKRALQERKNKKLRKQDFKSTKNQKNQKHEKPTIFILYER